MHLRPILKVLVLVILALPSYGEDRKPDQDANMIQGLTVKDVKAKEIAATITYPGIISAPDGFTYAD